MPCGAGTSLTVIWSGMVRMVGHDPPEACIAGMNQTKQPGVAGPEQDAVASSAVKVWIAHQAGLAHLGDLPASVDVQVLASPDDPPPSSLDGVEIWVPPFLASGPVVGFASKLPDLRVVQLVTAGADAWVGQ